MLVMPTGIVPKAGFLEFCMPVERRAGPQSLARQSTLQRLSAWHGGGNGANKASCIFISTSPNMPLAKTCLVQLQPILLTPVKLLVDAQMQKCKKRDHVPKQNSHIMINYCGEWGTLKVKNRNCNNISQESWNIPGRKCCQWVKTELTCLLTSANIRNCQLSEMRQKTGKIC